VVSWGAFNDIPNLTPSQLDTIQHAVRVAWMIAIFPVVKGLAQFIYAVFAESMKTLSDRFTVPAEVDNEPRVLPREQEAAATSYPRLDAPPASVTEHTTEIFDPVTTQAKREAQ
jgi:hypothetical protein